jgi:hypothetical protein
MPSSDPQPLAERELAWLLHSAIAWTVTGALMTAARKPLWDAVGVVLMALGLGLTGWVVQRRRHQPPRQLANWLLRYRNARSGSGGPARRDGGRHARVPARSGFGRPIPRDLAAFQAVRRAASSAGQAPRRDAGGGSPSAGGATPDGHPWV